jgi:hypothetical protein
LKIKIKYNIYSSYIIAGKAAAAACRAQGRRTRVRTKSEILKEGR